MQMLARERLLDLVLAGAEPVERGVEIDLVDGRERENRAEAKEPAVERGRREPTSQ